MGLADARNRFNPLPSPKRGETGIGGIAVPGERKFQSAPLTEARGDSALRFGLAVVVVVSIRSPHRSEGRLTTVEGERTALLVSIRSPHRSEGRLTATPNNGRLDDVSIRSPHRSEGRPGNQAGCPEAHNCFNPLPSPKRGETERQPASAGPKFEFQSAPLTEARGDPRASSSSNRAFSFQSAPLTEARGDPARRAPLSAGCRFNPLPSPKRGETSACIVHPREVFVSIRSPHRSEGRPAAQIVTLLDALFQSAPLTEARGDRRALPLSATASRFNPLPSPKRGETNLVGGWSFFFFCFNPLPSPKRGETVSTWPLPGLISVSIRSPHRSEGRPA